MEKKEKMKQEDREKPAGIETPDSKDIKDTGFKSQQGDPAFDKALPPEGENRGKEEENEVEDLKVEIVDYRGPVDPHVCPSCGARILGDRQTKACRVVRTNQIKAIKGNYVRDREMVCMKCSCSFIARESKSHGIIKR